MTKTKGKVVAINGNMVKAEFTGSVRKNEVCYILSESKRLKSEVIRINSGICSMQVYEMTGGIAVGDEVEFTGELLSVQLGPGLLGQVYDGLQNPLPALAAKCGYFLERGEYIEPLENNRWEVNPVVDVSDKLEASDVFATVQEGMIEHKLMLPFYMKGTWTVKSIVPKGGYLTHDTICTVENSETGETKDLTMVFSWPVKRAVDCYAERLEPSEPLVTQIRTIDTFFPVAKGGTYCTPGPFGAGKTVLQHLTSKNADVDIVIIAACGERAGEVVEVLKEFPELKDPRTSRSLMERTIIICNTSSMPVASREASVYTAVTMAEYYRQMGLNVLLLADSTSRWAQAMREMSGRLEEIPGDEAFPAYLESVIASFYERAGVVRLKNGKKGSVTIGGTVSPAGGNFDEPVTQATLKVVGAFHGLSRERSDARKYPAIHPLESWSKYKSLLDTKKVSYVRDFIFRSNDVLQMMKVVGEDGVGMDDYVAYQKGEFLDSVYLQQNSFDEIDCAVSPERQAWIFDVLYKILEMQFNFADKEGCRLYFNNLRQLFLDWNNTEFKSDAFTSAQNKIESLLAEKRA